MAGGYPAKDGEVPLPDWSAFEDQELAGLDDKARARLRERAIPSPEHITRDPQQLADQRRYDVPVTVISTEFTSGMLRNWIEQGLGPVRELARIRDVEYVDLPTGHWPQFTEPGSWRRPSWRLPEGSRPGDQRAASRRARQAASKRLDAGVQRGDQLTESSSIRKAPWPCYSRGMSRTTMRAVVLDRFGEPGVLRVDEVERPRPDGGEVLVRVHVTGANPVDAKIRRAGQWAQIDLPAVIGYDASGTVEEVRPGVNDLAVGDEVWLTPEIFGNQHGSYAEFLVAPARIVGRKPASLSHEQAAAVPLAGGTAWEAVVRRLAVRPGETVLIHAGAGGVGSFAVQFAKALGARVLATAGQSGQETLRDLGADVALDYRSDDVSAAAAAENGGAGVDAVLDLVGGDTAARSADVTRPFGRLATILGVQGDLTVSYLKNHTLYGVFLTRERERLDEMAPLFERGQVTPLVDDVRPLEDIVAVHERLDSGHGRGKVVLRVSDG